MSDPVFDQVLLETEIAVFDFEATSRFPYKAKIIQIGLAELVAGTPREAIWSQLINPGPDVDELDPWIVENVGITIEMLGDKPLFVDILPEFAERIGDRLIAGHNMGGYDRKLLRRENKNSYPVQDDYYLDTLAIERKINPGKGNKLKETAANHEIEFDEEKWHDGGYDALVTAKILAAQLRRLAKDNVRTFSDYLGYMAN